jgi:hypothetical protein
MATWYCIHAYICMTNVACLQVRKTVPAISFERRCSCYVPDLLQYPLSALTVQVFMHCEESWQPIPGAVQLDSPPFGSEVGTLGSVLGA